MSETVFDRYSVMFYALKVMADVKNGCLAYIKCLRNGYIANKTQQFSTFKAATNAADEKDATTASIIAYWPLRQPRQLRLLRTILAFIAFVTYFLCVRSLRTVRCVRCV